MTKFMGEGKKDGLMELSLQGYFKMAPKPKANLLGPMETYTKDTLEIINYPDLENLLGMMEDFTKVNGKII